MLEPVHDAIGRLNKKFPGYEFYAIFGVEGIDLCIPVSTERFFREVWERAIEEVDTTYFREYKPFYKSQLGEVFNELTQIKKWSIRNLSGTDLKYMSERIDETFEQLPNAFDREDAVLTLY